MSTDNLISIEIPSTELQTVKDSISAIETTLQPYLQSLTAVQRKALPKMSDSSLPFVVKTLDYAKSNAEFMPPYVSTEELGKDLTAVDQLMPVLRQLEQITSILNDTVTLAGSEAYVASLAYYNSVKMASKMNIPTAKVIQEDLSKRFAGQGRTKTPTV